MSNPNWVAGKDGKFKGKDYDRAKDTHVVAKVNGKQPPAITHQYPNAKNGGRKRGEKIRQTKAALSEFQKADIEFVKLLRELSAEVSMEQAEGESAGVCRFQKWVRDAYREKNSFASTARVKCILMLNGALEPASGGKDGDDNRTFNVFMNIPSPERDQPKLRLLGTSPLPTSEQKDG